ncbi:hypothetical protein C5167_034863 [Papaver somniferum]|uniref:Uncharacterized protein n=1 Tax=Papaver somniferum TaxID=3469 RepID=A0A4Y7KHN3_PAPSO|nr:hypothetical protein C5167_034863 [Papaver somniferum]
MVVLRDRLVVLHPTPKGCVRRMSLILHLVALGVCDLVVVCPCGQLGPEPKPRKGCSTKCRHDGVRPYATDAISAYNEASEMKTMAAVIA